ncbi:MAG: HAD family hydrolase [Candidatus Thermoplasmatota archaeon]|nr:HAD family hydrolase [Candidatus Thermoplasmatota archaeon]
MMIFPGTDAVFFDLGNTLIPFTPKDSMEFVVKWYWSSGMEGHGVPFNTFLESYREVVREEHSRMLGERWETSVAWRSGKLIDVLSKQGYEMDGSIDDLRSTHSESFTTCLRSPRDSRYVLDMIRTARNENGCNIKLGLISNAGDPEAIRKFLDRDSLTSIFDEIVISGEVGYSKPWKEIFTVPMEKINVVPERSVYIGDRYRVDFVGSRDAGMRPVYIRQYMTAGEPPTNIVISPTIDHILDLLPLLERGIGPDNPG